METALKSINIDACSNYTLECLISGEPEPKCTWYKDNAELDSMCDEIRSTYQSSKYMNMRQLTILNANPHIHSGAYTCIARNEIGEAQCNCEIVISNKLFKIFFFLI